MRIRALRNKNAATSPCGATVQGQVYLVPEELSAADCKIFLAQKWAEPFEEEQAVAHPTQGLTTESAGALVDKPGKHAGKGKG